MSEYQFEVTGVNRKIDGKEYKPGELFDYDPDNLAHKQILDIGFIKIVKAKAPKPVPAKKEAPAKQPAKKEPAKK